MRLLFDLQPCDPSLGLAIEEVLLDAARNERIETVRFWINQPSIIVGRSQSMGAEVDVMRAEGWNIPILRRVSGGGTVFHYPGNLNISVALQKRNGLADVPAIFRFFGDAIVTTLAGAGIAVRCEDNGLYIGDLKIAGAAQAHRGSAVLYHTTLLVRPSPVPMKELLLAMQSEYLPAGVASRPRATTSLEQIVQAPVCLEQVARDIGDTLASVLNVTMEAGTLSQTEERHAEMLRDSKYGSHEWNARM